MDWHCMTKESIAKELQTDLNKGLSKKEVTKRQKTYGYNILEGKKKKNLVIRYFSQFADFMIITLIIAAAISFFVSLLHGELDFVDPIIILLIINLNAILGLLQETKAEKSLEALQKMSAPSALVLREGTILTIDAKDLVPGDIIYLETGHFVPADARLLQSVNLKIEEASLTGESHPVEKNATDILPASTLLADRHNMVLATGIVTYGRGMAIVTATGMNTEVGHIARLIMEDESPMTPLQKKLAATGKVLGIAALGICILIFIIGILKQMPIFEMFMTSVSLAVAAIPEGLPTIVTIMLSLGVQRMAKKNAVIRKLPAVETLGSATIICSDKTGTLTQNKMTVTEIASLFGKESLISEFSDRILTLASLCNDSILQFIKDGKTTTITATGEPTEKALIMAAYHNNIEKPNLDKKYPRIYEVPFDSTRKLMSTIHTNYNGKTISITKGAPDVLLNRCSYILINGVEQPITKAHLDTISKHNQSMTENALRVLAVAYKYIPTGIISPKGAPISDTVKSFNDKLETGLVFVGLVGMIDPPREEVAGAVLTCKMAGITPIMITGDHISTACAIAKELGILGPNDKAITGAQLSQMSNETLIKEIPNYKVFARVSPEHKVRIVKAFQSRGEVVAMTGDGVNDAPALKAADIGCAMGISGTDVAKNAADMVLTDDNFATIVSAVKEGRGIYDNIIKSVHFLLSCNIGEIITILVAILMGLPSPLLAVQLLWVNLVTDSLPAISLGVEPAPNDIMKKKPIPPTKGMFSDGLLVKILFEGTLIGLLALLSFIFGVKLYDSALISDPILRNSNVVTISNAITPNVGRTMAFAVLSLSQLFHSFNMRSEHSLTKIGFFTNTKLIGSFIICVLLQVSVISIEPLANIFSVVPLTLPQWSTVLVFSFLPIVVVELQKSVQNK